MKTRVVQTASDPRAGCPPVTDVIRTRSLSKTSSGVDALSGLDLRVARHSIVGFLGPNGAGKTTTIKLLLGLARQTSGSAEIVGLDTRTESLAIRARVTSRRTRASTPP